MNILKKIIMDLVSTLYDDFEYKYISLPRIWCAISGICIVVAEIAELYFDKKFSGWTQLVAWASTCLGAYAAKKYVERGKDNNGENRN